MFMRMVREKGTYLPNRHPFTPQLKPSMDFEQHPRSHSDGQTNRRASIDSWVERLKTLLTHIAPEKIRLGFAFEVV